MDAPRLAGFERRPDRLGSMFSAISWRYDLLNQLMSLGQDQSWRRALAATIAPGERVLDLCCGSARSSEPAARRSRRATTGLDVSFAMLERGKQHARARAVAFDPVHGDAFALPFRDCTFDVVIAAFGLRNLVPLAEAAREIGRVLRPGGRFLALDSVAPAPGPFAPFHAFYLQNVVPLLGRLSPDPQAYRYLSESIFDFGAPAAVVARLEQAGFAPVRARSLFFGAVALFEAVLPNVLSMRAAPTSVAVQSDVSASQNAQVAMPGAPSTTTAPVPGGTPEGRRHSGMGPPAAPSELAGGGRR